MPLWSAKKLTVAEKSRAHKELNRRSPTNIPLSTLFVYGPFTATRVITLFMVVAEHLLYILIRQVFCPIEIN